MSPLQKKCADALRSAKHDNNMLSTTRLADRVKSNNVAVTSAMRALERKGLAGSTPSDNSQWAVRVWFMKHTTPSTNGTTSQSGADNER